MIKDRRDGRTTGRQVSLTAVAVVVNRPEIRQWKQAAEPAGGRDGDY